MKKIVSGNELREKIGVAITMLCGTVKSTLGPKGSNVIIDHSNFSPFITNDGVTIALNIESDDPVINTILELTKEASVKTNETVGDGTTTTLVLLEAIYNYGMKLMDEGVSPIILKKELDSTLLKILNMIDKHCKDATKGDLQLIACNSANSMFIGKIVSDAFLKVKNRSSILLKEGNFDCTKINYIKGYTFDSVLASPYFLNKNEINFNSPFVLIINEIIDDIEMISENLNNIIKNNNSLVVIAKDYSAEVTEQVLSLYLDENVDVVLLKNPEFGIREYYFEKDIKAILDNQTDGYKSVKNIKINKDRVTISFNSNKSLTNYIKKLKKIENNSEFDKSYIEEKISMFQNGIAEIVVGANTITERRELKMRYEDAICAVSSCKEGILPGSGIIYSLICEDLNDDSVGDEIFKNALTKPLEQILINASTDSYILNEIKNSHYNKIYNVKTNKFENIKNTKILDPNLVVKNALKNACSIASMLLTTDSLVINEYKNELQKVNDFNEM